MKLQSCTACGAQFDLSEFTAGQQFSCPCGAVLTAGAAAAAPPPAPPARTPGRTPGAAARTPGPVARRTGPASPPAGARLGARPPGGPAKVVKGGPGSAAKGPQYQPVQRAGQAKAAPAAPKAPAGGRRTRSETSGAEAAPRSGRPAPRGGAGPNRGLLIGAGLVVMLVVVLLLALGGDDSTAKGTGGGGESASNGGSSGAHTPPPVVPSETPQEVMAQYANERPTTLSAYMGFIGRLKAIGGDEAEQKLQRVYKDFIAGPGRDQKEARAALGYKEFPHQVPEDIAFREYPYLKAVDIAYNKHWFGPDETEEYDLAMSAWKQTEEHFEKLVNDHKFRAADNARSLIAHDQFFKDYNYAARWAEPYLICYASTDRLSEYDLLSEDKETRKRKLEELKEKRKAYEAVLDEKALIFQQLYKEFFGRYKDSLGLKPLMAPYGGREDYPIGVRSYQDGAPMVVWIFDSKKAFNEYHTKVKQDNSIHPNVAGYFSPATSYVYLYDEPEAGDNRVFEINKNVHEGTHQLEFWFTRQRNKWRKPHPGQDWFGEGIAEFIGSTHLYADGRLEFLGVNVPRLKSMQQGAKALERQGQKYRKFPVEQLVSFGNYGEVRGWGATTWSLNPDLVLLMFYEQSWAFTYFLNTYDNGKYKERFDKFFDLVLHRETGVSKGADAFKQSFRIRDEDDWEELNDAFHKFIDDVLMKMDPAKYDYTPPARGSFSVK